DVRAEAVQGLLDAEVRRHVLLGVARHRPQRHDDDQEDQGERREHERERDLVRRALPDGPFDQGDHAVEERLAGRRMSRTTIESDRTVAPPVTPDRSPPASRMTGADSPVIADSSTDATPSMISPSPGMT